MDKTSPFEPTSELLREHMPIVHRVVAQFARRLPRSVPREDLVAAGMVGLYQALKKGLPTCPAMFASYATIRVRGAIYDELRRADWFPRRRRDDSGLASGDDATAGGERHERRKSSEGRSTREHAMVRIDDTDGTQPLSAGDGTPSEHVEKKYAYLALRGAIEALPARERSIVHMRYFDDMSGKAVASALGLSEARVCATSCACHRSPQAKCRGRRRGEAPCRVKFRRGRDGTKRRFDGRTVGSSCGTGRSDQRPRGRRRRRFPKRGRAAIAAWRFQGHDRK